MKTKFFTLSLIALFSVAAIAEDVTATSKTGTSTTGTSPAPAPTAPSTEKEKQPIATEKTPGKASTSTDVPITTGEGKDKVTTPSK